MGQATIFAGQKIKTLKDTLTLNGKSDIISSMVDPTASAVDAPIGSLLINQTSGKLYRKLDAGSSVNWEEVGAGVGGINYILNPSAEVNTTGWATYADAAGTAPVDGTGGSPNVTWTRSTTSPLRGVADFNFVKDAANRQGQGVSYDFTIDEADKAKVLSVTFDYEVLSGTYADGDLTVYLIADPTGTPVVIQPAGYTVQSATVGTTMREIATFQTQATGLSYRLCFHVASTSASAYTLAIDNVVVGPQQTVQGAAISDWVEESITVTADTGTLTNYQAYRLSRRVGDSIELKYWVNFTGAPGTWANPRLPLPSNITIDAQKYASSSTSKTGIIGMARTRGPGFTALLLTGFNTAENYIFVRTQNVTTHVGSAAVTDANFTDSFPVTQQNSSQFTTETIMLPVSGWSSNTVLSQNTDTRVVAGSFFTTTSTVVTTSPVNITYSGTTLDTHAAFSSGTTYKVPVSGVYRVFSQALFECSAFTSLEYVDLGISLNGNGFSISRTYIRNTGFASLNPTDVVLSLKAGDEIRSYALKGSNNISGAIYLDGGFSKLLIQRLSGPATIAASETVGFNAAGTAGDSIGTSLSLIKFTTIQDNTHGAYSASTGLFTAPVSGRYSASWLVSTAPVTLATNERFASVIYKGPSAYRNGQRALGTGVLFNFTSGGSVQDIYLMAGETLSVYAVSSVSTTAATGLEPCYFSVVKVGL